MGAGDRVLEDRDWQRLDKWLWHARYMKTRADCARHVAEGGVRVNRQPTDKPHARLRVDDVVTLPARDGVRVLRIAALARRRGPAAEARMLYDELPEPGPSPTCNLSETLAHGPAQAWPGERR